MDRSIRRDNSAPILDIGDIVPVTIAGIKHQGEGEFQGISHEDNGLYIAGYNIDGCDWVYEASIDEDKLQLNLGRVLVGSGALTDGVIEHIDYDKISRQWAVSFSTATSPSQIYSIEPGGVVQHTRERLLGIPDGLLSAGEDASFTSFDGLRISARLYLPASHLNFTGTRPLVYYIHGGPQSQERPDFAWFSMPLIQFLTMNGFAVFVPNVRGSTGYGQAFRRANYRDWGGKDVQDVLSGVDHVINLGVADSQRLGIMGWSYGGYLTAAVITQTERFRAAVIGDGMVDLVSYATGHDSPGFVPSHFGGEVWEVADLLLERSPIAHVDRVTTPTLILHGEDDQRVPIWQGYEFYNALTRRGCPVQMVVYPHTGHTPADPKSLLDVMERILAWMKTYI